ncbi:hypothetical protein XENTR_v10020821 [Xenopus tropicalis]|nr:hypothetical protein XENTR_v10020821 [Xenopus tropicalis]
MSSNEVFRKGTEPAPSADRRLSGRIEGFKPLAQRMRSAEGLFVPLTTQEVRRMRDRFSGPGVSVPAVFRSWFPVTMSDATVADTRRLNSKPQDLTDAYGPPSNFLEIDIFNPQTVGVGRNRYTVYEVRMRTNLPIFKLKDSCVRRRYSDFEWLKNELERDSKIVVPPLPGKALKRQLPFRGDEGIFEESFIEERKQGLEQFINKIAGHPLAQNERCLHMFLQDETIDRNYVPGKVRQ